MIRQLTEQDHQQVLQLIGKKPAENLFIIGDLEAYGYDSDIQQLYGEFHDEQLIALLLNYDHMYVMYAEGIYDVEGFARIVNKDEQLLGLSGMYDILTSLYPLIEKTPKRSGKMHYAKCTALIGEAPPHRFTIRKTTVEDIPQHRALLQQIPEFANSTTTEEQMIRTIENQTGRTYALWEDNQIVSVVSTAAENLQSAMIVGVATHPDYVKRGYATALLYRMCEELLAEDKVVCLFYDNPKAGKIYERIGFEPIGYWGMHNF